MDGVSNSVCSV